MDMDQQGWVWMDMDGYGWIWMQFSVKVGFKTARFSDFKVRICEGYTILRLQDVKFFRPEDCTLFSLYFKVLFV